MATKREVAPISDKRVKQIFMPGDILAQGNTRLEYKGYDLLIFDRERMLVELVRYKSKLPLITIKTFLEITAKSCHNSTQRKYVIMQRLYPKVTR